MAVEECVDLLTVVQLGGTDFQTMDQTTVRIRTDMGLHAGGVADNNRRFVNAVLWILRTGAPWRDLPASYGDWKNTHRRFCRWRDKGIWEALLEQLIDDPDYEWLMIDASHCKIQASAAGARGGNDGIGRTKGGSIPSCTWPWMRAWYAGPNTCNGGYPSGLCQS